MLLSTQLFDRIVGLSGSQASDAHRKQTVLPVGCRRVPERRSATRMAYGHRTQICCDGGKKAGVWDTVMLQDISLSGIGCLCHQPMDIGGTFVLKLADKDGESIRIRCKVQRCERGGFGNTAYLVGSTFEQVIQQQEMRLNDDEYDMPVRQEEVQTEPEIVMAASESSGLRTMARVAVNLFKASLWMRKSDDFSSVG
jgi:PilZ domain